jgi:hypothetical protein
MGDDSSGRSIGPAGLRENNVHLLRYRICDLLISHTANYEYFSLWYCQPWDQRAVPKPPLKIQQLAPAAKATFWTQRRNPPRRLG